jgi:uncharacterized protein (UPF0335 family)
LSDLRGYITRVMNVLAEIDDLGADKKEIYKEIASAGFDRTVVSQVVGHLRKKAAKPGKFAEQSALFDLYLKEFEGVGTPVATHAARDTEEIPPHDADGVILETSSQAIDGAFTSHGRQTPSAGTGGEADRQPIHAPRYEAAE